MNIDEMALKVRNKTGFPIFEEDIPKFASALIAEYEKAVNSDPVVIEYPDYHNEAMGCGLEDCEITDRYEAMRYGWDIAVGNVFAQIPEGLLYPRPDPRVSELEAKLQQMNSLCEFNERTMSDIASKYEALEAQIAALLAVIEAKDAALDALVSWVDDWAETSDTDFTRIETQVNAARALSPSAELLEARDRKRDAKLIRQVNLVINKKGYFTDYIYPEQLKQVAADRESGEWKPELGD